MHKLSVVIITFNEEGNVLRCIQSVKDLADEILVVDSLSTDRTVEICKEAGCKVILQPFEGYGEQKQFGVDQAEYDWILSLDADEEVTQELKEEIRSLLAFEKIPCVGYNIPFSLIYMGKLLRHTGSDNLRFFDRTKSRFRFVKVHESVDVDGPVGRTKGKVLHHSYRDLEHHLDKINLYTTRAAEGYLENGRKFSKIWVVFKFPINFFIYYIVRLGILDGYPGFIWALLAAFYSSMKVAKTIEMEEKKQ